MLERADARLWFSMIAIAIAVPAVVFVISAIWFMRFYFAPPTILAAAPLGPSALAQVEVAVPPTPAGEPVAPRLAAQTPKTVSTMPMLGDAHPAYSDPALDISTVVSPVMPAKPAAVEPSEPIAGPVPPVLAQAEAPAPQTRDAKASELASAPPAVALPMLGDAHPAYSDPALDISTVVSPVMPAKPAAVEPSETIEGPIPLPRPKPRVTVAHVSRTVPLARSPTVASSPRPTSRH